MQLLWLHYTGKRSRYILLLELGERDGKICGIETKAIDGHTKNKIKSVSSSLSRMSLTEKISWIRQQCPHAMGGYKEILLSNIQIVNTYPITSVDKY